MTFAGDKPPLRYSPQRLKDPETRTLCDKDPTRSCQTLSQCLSNILFYYCLRPQCSKSFVSAYLGRSLTNGRDTREYSMAYARERQERHAKRMACIHSLTEL
jgi:hypothetical protein